jgi:hypothetical protein
VRTLGTLLLSAAWASGGPDPVGEALDAARLRPAEERWRLVPWRTSLAAGLAEAKERNLPLFLFGYDGILGSGNC